MTIRIIVELYSYVFLYTNNIKTNITQNNNQNIIATYFSITTTTKNRNEHGVCLFPLSLHCHYKIGASFKGMRAPNSSIFMFVLYFRFNFSPY